MNTRLMVTAGLAAATLAACAENAVVTVADATVVLSPMADAGHSSREGSAGEPVDGTAYVTVHGGLEADSLVAVRSEVADAIELHVTEMDGAVMRMTHVSAIEVPAGGEMRLEPGGAHAMIFGLTSGVDAGDVVTLTLVFERAGEVSVAARVETAFP
jgi:copper(I)-binding protein